MFPGSPHSSMRRGQLVRVRTEREIVATLDAFGRLEGMPFMPEMARFCGQAFRISRRAGRTCVEGQGFRRLRNTVLLDVRCDGRHHQGCQRNCMIFWKEAWLEPASGAVPSDPPERTSEWARSLPTMEGERFHCQSTQLAEASLPISRWNPLPLVAEFLSGELSLFGMARILLNTGRERLREALGLPGAKTLRGVAQRPLKGDLDLRAGEWVEVKTIDELQETLDVHGKNRGLSFEPSMVPLTGGRFQVEYPIERIIHERTGKMVPLEHTVALRGVFCYGSCTKNCPRGNTLFWRENWLKRVPPPLPGSEESPRPDLLQPTPESLPGLKRVPRR